MLDLYESIFEKEDNRIRKILKLSLEFIKAMNLIIK